MPLSNVLWLSYLLDYLITQYTSHGPAKKKSTNRQEIEESFIEMQNLLNFDPRSSIEGERLSSAADCLAFCIELGWIGEDQLEGDMDKSVLSDGASFVQHLRGEVGDKTPQKVQQDELRKKPQHIYFSPTPQKMALRSRTPSPTKTVVSASDQVKRQDSPSSRKLKSRTALPSQLPDVEQNPSSTGSIEADSTVAANAGGRRTLRSRGRV